MKDLNKSTFSEIVTSSRKQLDIDLHSFLTKNNINNVLNLPSNTQLLTFQARSRYMSLDQLKKFLLDTEIKGKVIPYKINWDLGLIIFKVELDKNGELKEKDLLKLMKDRGFFKIQSSSFLEIEKHSHTNQHSPLLALTGPRSAGKNYIAEHLLSLFNEQIEFVPQITYRKSRPDDDKKYIRIVSREQFLILKNDMYVSSGKYGILKQDVEKVKSAGKIPLLILGWKEIIKLKKHKNNSLLVHNITYPINIDGSLSQETINTIHKRIHNRGGNNIHEENDVDMIRKYMQLFFNHPIFMNIFHHTYITTQDSIEDITKNIGHIIDDILI